MVKETQKPLNFTAVYLYIRAKVYDKPSVKILNEIFPAVESIFTGYSNSREPGGIHFNVSDFILESGLEWGGGGSALLGTFP